MTSVKNAVISHHIFEMRFKPNARILDFPGQWTEYLSAEMNLPDWRIDITRMDLYDNKNQAFLSFKNCGFVSALPDTKNYFEDQASKFLRTIFKLKEFKSTPVTRLGVRSTFLNPYPGDFKSLFEKYKSKVIKPADETMRALGGELIDIGVPLNFKDGDAYFNTMSGPMTSLQIKRFFPIIETVPEVGLFFEIDYFKENIGEPEVEQLVLILKTFSQRSWQKMESLSKLVLE
ncbi:MAG: hypothetical protein Q8O10_01210 [candidate division Zixibacteria bacterium]|nr:hypothetical protein [candidate division Zixibacteria bacterium]